jgi:pyruvate,water dikinase
VARALEVLGPHDTVTVDADRRVIYAGKVGDVLARPAAVSGIVGSPVHAALEAAAEHIVPLRLIDPAAPEFVPASCGTLHDITRLCHEKSVQELVRFGDEHALPKRASRRLFTDVATQFWVVDLDDGIDEEATDPHLVRLTEVRSVPMRALWRGMHLVPWGGPPPVDAKGFLGLVAGSAMNPNLDPATASDYSSGSHFFVTRSYCGFQYRVGYHFATVEALVGEDVPENFVRFQFSGGGASTERRHRRARMIAEILEAKGFRVQRQGDAVSARFDGHDRGVTEWGLVVLGYLMVQTRQLDMAMADETAVERYRQQLLDGLEQSSID